MSLNFPLPDMVVLEIIKHLSNKDLESLRTAFPELHHLKESQRTQAARVIVPFVRNYLDLGPEARGMVTTLMKLFAVIDNPGGIDAIRIGLPGEKWNYKRMDDGWFKRKSLLGNAYTVRIKHPSEKIKQRVLERRDELCYIFLKQKYTDVLYETTILFDRDLKYYYSN